MRDQRVVIVQCTGRKRDGRHRARDLYDESRYFRKQRRYARNVADTWYIQSAAYGLVRPDDCIHSYDKHAKDLDDAEGWAAGIANDLYHEHHQTATIEILGGRAYADPLRPALEALGFEDVREPLDGMEIGRREQWLTQQALEVSDDAT